MYQDSFMRLGLELLVCDSRKIGVAVFLHNI